MLIDLKESQEELSKFSSKALALTATEAMLLSHTMLMIAIAERLDRIAAALERPQQGAYLSPEE